MISRKGFLLAEETIKIIIALICIFFLIYLLVSLYYSNKNSKDLELAKASLDHFISETNAGQTEIEIYNPSSSQFAPGGWIMISFPLGNVKPESCKNLGWASCLCICDEAATTIRDSGLAEDCDNTGICVDSNLRVVGKKIKFENPPIILELNGGSISKK